MFLLTERSFWQGLFWSIQEVACERCKWGDSEFTSWVLVYFDWIPPFSGQKSHPSLRSTLFNFSQHQWLLILIRYQVLEKSCHFVLDQKLKSPMAKVFSHSPSLKNNKDTYKLIPLKYSGEYFTHSSEQTSNVSLKSLKSLKTRFYQTWLFIIFNLACKPFERFIQQTGLQDWNDKL